MQNQRRKFLAVACASALGGCSTSKSDPLSERQEELNASAVSHSPSDVGVSLAGPEFGVESVEFSNSNPGTAGQDYTFAIPKTVRYFTENQISLFRIPIRWERIQPTLGGELDGAYLNKLKKLVGIISGLRGHSIIDLHNYGRYVMRINSLNQTLVINKTSRLRTSHLENLWNRLAQEFKNEESVDGFCIMNEPYSMGPGNWRRISNDVVDCIRETDQKKKIYVCGDEWSSAERFDKINGKPWIRQSKNVIYESHAYFDSDRSGKYKKSFEQEAAADRQIKNRFNTVLQPFIDWCRSNRAQGFVGEIGVPGSTNGWLEQLNRGLGLLAKNNMPFCYWAAGEWWKNYPLSIQPRADNQPQPQFEILQKYIGTTKRS